VKQLRGFSYEALDSKVLSYLVDGSTNSEVSLSGVNPWILALALGEASRSGKALPT